MPVLTPPSLRCVSLRRQVIAALWPYRVAFLVALVQVGFIAAAELLKPWPLKVIIDHVLGGQPLSWFGGSDWSRELLLLVACSGLVVIYLVLGALNVWNNYTTIRIGQSMVNDLRGTLYDHLQRLSLAFHNRRHVGDLLYRVTADTYAIQTLTMNGVFPILTSLVLLVGMTIVMLRLDWVLTLLALAVCPVLFGTITAMSGRINAAATVARERESAIYSLVQRTMAAIRVIQAFTKEEEEQRRFLSASRASLAANLRLYVLQTCYAGIVNVVIAIGTAAVVWVGARHVMSGTLSVGELVVFTAYLASLYGPINTISQTLGLIEGAKAGLARVHEILAVERDLPEGQRVLERAHLRGEITFEQVTFGYTPDRPVLHTVNLRVAPGQTVAIVGPTGAGKSTLVSLLPRFYDPQAGRILLDGTDLREFTLASLRRQIAMVLQPPLVFPLSIKENIAYGRPAASMEAIEQAARLARIHETIMRLPHGYDTVVGEQGATLSEGERQRLTIARAILRDAPILILDEPTSSVDAETEALIMEGLEQLMAGRTTFIIAHRLSTVRRADVILVLRGGQIVEQGTFAELLRRQGAFAALYHTQFRTQEEPRRAVS
ncbi:MAG: ABC transporter ATP-binding protein/permease [Candidatus Binatia bacterium]|nr:ABC transporter ATP-binding protein/permease [Candidatus Binatia bacterium]